MFRQKKKKFICISIIIILYIIKVGVSCENNYFFNIKDGKPLQNTSYILSDSYDNSFILANQTTRKIWVYQKTCILSGNIIPDSIVLVQLFVSIILLVIINKSERIKKLCTMRFNGTKYKGGRLLP